MNPSYRTSSPQPSTLESHHDPDSALAKDLGMSSAHVSPHASQPNSADHTPRKPMRQHNEPHEASFRSSGNSSRGYPPAPQPGDFPEVPHNEYPTDGMTQFCRINPPNGSDLSSNVSPGRPSSRDSQSEYSNPTSFSSQEPSLGSGSPTKGLDGSSISQRATSEAEQKKSGFFQNRSPFRRKSRSGKDQPQSFAAPSSNRNTRAHGSAGAGRRGMPFTRNQQHGRMSPSPEPADPRASFQLNVGNNVFDVASPDVHRKGPPQQAAGDQDEMARALAAVKDLTKQASVRMPANASGGPSMRGRQTQLPDRTTAARSHAGQTQPQQPPSRLGAPQPAHTARQMQQTSQHFAAQNRNMFNSPSPQSRPSTHIGQQPGRPTSPMPMRSTSPRPDVYGNGNMNRMSQPNLPRATSPNPNRMSQGNLPRAASPNPYLQGDGNPNSGSRPRAQSTSPVKSRNADPYAAQRTSYGGANGEQIPRARSPRPGYAGSQAGDGMAMQLAPAPSDRGSVPQGQYPPRPSNGGRPMSTYGGTAQQGGIPGRSRSKSFGGGATGGQQVSKDGRPVLHFGEWSQFKGYNEYMANTFTSASDVHVPSGNPGGAIVCQRRGASSLTAPG